jgi:C4-dicarboxylate-specific signal transduction histidine kinase
MMLEAGYPAGSVEGSEGWKWVSDQVVAGICHDLNDRLSALSGLLELAELDGAVDPELGGPLRSELVRVEELVRLLRLLPGGRVEGVEPVRVVELLEVAAALLRRHRGLEDVTVEVETGVDAVVRASWGALNRVLLLLLAGAARCARQQGSDRVAVRVDGDADRAAIRVAAVPGGAEGELWEACRPVAAVVEGVGGALEGAGAAVVLRLPLWGE